MTDSTTPQDDAAMSPASAGSAAWPSVGMISENRLRELMADVGWPYSRSLRDALRQCDMEARLDVVARLRLTDAEREALIHAMAALDHVGTDWTLQCAATLRGLLERLGGER